MKMISTLKSSVARCQRCCSAVRAIFADGVELLEVLGIVSAAHVACAGFSGQYGRRFIRVRRMLQESYLAGRYA